MQVDELICRGKYRLLRSIGQGSYGQVWLAEEVISRTQVAIKFALLANEEARQRFDREIQLTRKLDHPHLLNANTIDQEGDSYLLVMPYLEGGSLRDRLADGPLPIADALRIATEIAEGLAYLHERDIIHRDVHPGNVLFTKEGSVKLADLGLVQTTDSSASLWYGQKSDRHPGNIYYQPPEATASPGQALAPLYPAADVYMLGAVLWEMLTGKQYYYRKEKPPSLERSEIPKSLDVLVMRLLAPQASQRPVNGADAARLLRGGSETNHDNGKHRVKALKNWGLAAGGVLLAGLTIGIIYFFTPKPTETPIPLATVTPQPTSPPNEPSACTSIGQTWTSPVDGLTLSCVPGGEFWMGSTDSDSQASIEEKPRHKVYLDAFWIDRTEVTNAMFTAFVRATNYQTDAEKGGWGYAYNPSTEQWEQTNGADWQHPFGPSSDIQRLEDHPVVQVSWNDAEAYCAWVGRKLPSEAQWEKAARGEDERIYSWGSQPPTGNRLNFADANLAVSWADKSIDDGYQFTAPVGSYPAGASPYDVLDMAGNVWEWVADWYGEGYYSTSPDRNPTGPSSGEYRVLRGGSWYDEARVVRAAYRVRDGPNVPGDRNGFRCSR